MWRRSARRARNGPGWRQIHTICGMRTRRVLGEMAKGGVVGLHLAAATLSFEKGFAGGRPLGTDPEVDVASRGPATAAGQSDGSADSDSAAGRDTSPSDAPAFMRWIPRLGVWAWSFVGFVVAAIIVVTALGAISEIVLPLTFAAVLAVIFKPMVGTLRRHGFKPTLAAGLIVLGLLALMTAVVVATV